MWIKKNWKLLLIGFLSLTAGFLLQLWANQRSEQRVINAILAEIKTLKDKQNIGRTTAADQNRLIGLQAQLNLLT